jgi:hypothetical protein
MVPMDQCTTDTCMVGVPNIWRPPGTFQHCLAYNVALSVPQLSLNYCVSPA